jgi:hypothetical protein
MLFLKQVGAGERESEKEFWQFGMHLGQALEVDIAAINMVIEVGKGECLHAHYLIATI